MYQNIRNSFIARRLVQSLLTVIVVVLLNFILLHTAPGDVVDILATDTQMGDAAQIAQLRAELGLDKPLYIQLLKYYVSLSQLDLGYSYRQSAPVLDVILTRLPATILLMVASVLTSLIIGMILGTIAANRPHTMVDSAITTGAMIAYATPSFLTGLLMILAFSIGLRWLPVSGMTTAGSDYTGFQAALDVLLHLIMPAATLSLIYVGIYTRLMRAKMLEILTHDYVRTARAKGISTTRILYRHAARNALPPMVVMCGVQITSLFGGTVVVETIFGWPGIGLLAFNAVFQRDYPLLLGILFISSIVVMITGLIVDLVLMKLDPRVKL